MTDDATPGALRSSAGLGAWRPIETAPRDGTKVLAWNKGCGHWVASFRLPTYGEPQNESHYVKEWRDGGGRWATPTHWMPLPAEPKDDGMRPKDWDRW